MIDRIRNLRPSRVCPSTDSKRSGGGQAKRAQLVGPYVPRILGPQKDAWPIVELQPGALGLLVRHIESFAAKSTTDFGPVRSGRQPCRSWEKLCVADSACLSQTESSFENIAAENKKLTIHPTRVAGSASSPCRTYSIFQRSLRPSPKTFKPSTTAPMSSPGAADIHQPSER